MADKSATIYIVDLGASTADYHNGRTESDLDYGMRYIYAKIGDIMLASKTSWGVGVIGFRTDETNNDLADTDDSYQNISVLKPLGPMQMPDLKDLRTKLATNEASEGDAISAIVVGIELIVKFTTLKTGKPGKYGRKIVLLTDGEGEIEDADIDPIAQRINEVGIDLVVVGVDFDDAEYGFKEEDKSEVKRRNEKILTDLTDKCSNAVFGTVEAAISDLDIPLVKATRPYSTYKGRLSLGNFEKYPETAMYIDVERYFRTKSAKPVSATSYVTRLGANGASQTSSHTIQGDTEMVDGAIGDLSVVRTTRTYRVNDADGAGGKRDVEREDLAKGYEYGRTAVHVSESDENVTAFESFVGFEIIGFIPNDKYERFLNIGESCITIPMQSNDKARIALSSFVRSLAELESYAVARLVTKAGKDPQILLLAPSIERDLEALVDVPLPFAEDVRVYRFPPLDRVVTTSGTTLTKHRNLPNDELLDAMGAYVDSMDLSAFDKDEDGQPDEYMLVEDTYSPMIHRINQAIRRRAVHPDEPIASPPKILVKYSNPPLEIVSDSAHQLSTLIKAADVKKVPPRVKGKRRREQIKPISGLDVESILNREKRQKITKENSVAEFRQMLAATEEETAIAQAVNQLAAIIREHIKTSTGDAGYERALENIRVMREEMIEFETPETYNEFMLDLKKQLWSEKLGEHRKDFILAVKNNGLGLIDSTTSDASNVSKAQASEFLSMSSGIPDCSRSS